MRCSCFKVHPSDCNEYNNRNTTDLLNERLKNLREKLLKYELAAYIVPNEDDHQSELTAIADKRRKYISGFTGSAGHALITLDKATLWTDGRYFLQAEQELPVNWTLVPAQRANILSMKDWLIDHLSEGNRVGIDPKKICAEEWKKLNTTLLTHKIQLVALENNLIDEIWIDRPQYSDGSIFVHELIYCGETHSRKLERLREQMKRAKSDVLIISALSEIAWLFNLRGNDIPNSPLFLSFALIYLNSSTLYVKEDNLEKQVLEHLNSSESEIKVKGYNDFWGDVTIAITNANMVFVPKDTSYAIYSMVPKNKIFYSASPLIDLKATKNQVEIDGSRKAHIRDAIAICLLFKRMEEEIPNGIYWDEMKVVDVLDQLREENGDNLYKGPSFDTIAAFGPNSAIPHYRCQPSTNLVINTTAPLTLDSGGQYLDGTIDTTRVVHFGQPTAFHKEIYTLILKGVIDLADTIFPEGIRSDALDILARRHLLKHGLTFTHGTTHGTGVFSNVHEKFNGTYFENFIGSQEPGYYLKDYFGMRLENLVVVRKANVQNVNNPKRLLAFAPLTLVPYERKLIDVKLLDLSQIVWLNNYHDKVVQLVGREMINQGKQDLYHWLIKKTESIYQL